MASFRASSGHQSPPDQLVEKGNVVDRGRLDLDQYYLYDYQYRQRREGFGAGFSGWRIFAAFFGSLRANLSLADEDIFTMSTSASPTTPASSSSSAPALTLPPSSVDNSNANSTSTSTLTVPAPEDAPIPPLTTFVTTEPEKVTEALHLIADSIAQQRQTASRSVIFHPLTISIYIGVLALLSNYMWKTQSDLPLLFTTSAGVTMIVLVAVRVLTQGYLDHAESMKWTWLRSEGKVGEYEGVLRGEDDVVIVTEFGEEMVGAVVVRLEGAESVGRSGGRGKKGNRGVGGKALIRGWTTKLRYRGKEVGRNLLEEAVKLAREKLGAGVSVEFADGHANSHRILPFLFNGPFERREKRARNLLQEVVDQADSGEGKKRR